MEPTEFNMISRQGTWGLVVGVAMNLPCATNPTSVGKVAEHHAALHQQSWI